jgi:glycosyltransferase involved in cell wall biosynthesis
VGDFRRADRDWAAGLGLGDRLELLPFVDHRRTLELQRDSEALLLLLPEVGERGRDVPSGKLYEYLAAGRPILAAVPPGGAAANLVERAGAGIVVSPNDVAGQARALGDLVERRRRRALEPVRLEPGLRRELSRETRSGELAAFLRSLG